MCGQWRKWVGGLVETLGPSSPMTKRAREGYERAQANAHIVDKHRSMRLHDMAMTWKRDGDSRW